MKIIYDLPESDYHALPDMSSSRIKNLLVSAKYFRAQEIKSKFSEGTPEFRIGSAVHALMLNQQHPPQIIVSSVKGANTKTFVQEQMDNPDAIILLEKENELVEAMVSTSKNDPMLQELLSVGAGEVTIRGEYQGLESKCRFDFIRQKKNGRHQGIDLKTTADIPNNISMFSTMATNFGYHIQNQFYMNLANQCDELDMEEFIFIFLEKKPPFDYVIVKMPLDLLQIAQVQIDKAIDIFNECQRTDIYPGKYDGKVITLETPRYMKDII